VIIVILSFEIVRAVLHDNGLLVEKQYFEIIGPLAVDYKVQGPPEINNVLKIYWAGL
jgi:hypothetical protein